MKDSHPVLVISPPLSPFQSGVEWQKSQIKTGYESFLVGLTLWLCNLYPLQSRVESFNLNDKHLKKIWTKHSLVGLTLCICDLPSLPGVNPGIFHHHCVHIPHLTNQKLILKNWFILRVWSNQTFHKSTISLQFKTSRTSLSLLETNNHIEVNMKTEIRVQQIITCSTQESPMSSHHRSSANLNQIDKL